jgi:hypothetical protein
MARIAILAGLAALVTAQSVQADPWPHRKPGLWQSTTTIGGSPMGPINSKFCMDLATEAALTNFGREAGKACSGAQIHMSGNTGTIDATCKFGSMTSVSHTVITFYGDTAYRSEIHSRVQPPPKFGNAEHTTISESKWVGPCPAGMKPGDLVMNNGVHTHIGP